MTRNRKLDDLVRHIAEFDVLSLTSLQLSELQKEVDRLNLLLKKEASFRLPTSHELKAVGVPSVFANAFARGESNLNPLWFEDFPDEEVIKLIDLSLRNVGKLGAECLLKAVRALQKQGVLNKA